MQRIIVGTLLAASSLFAIGCSGQNDCQEAYERMKAKYDDCRIDTSNLPEPGEDAECSDRQGESDQELADTVENGTCESIRRLIGAE